MSMRSTVGRLPIIDALLEVIDRIRNNKEVRAKFDKEFSFLDKSRQLVLVTGHSCESFGDGTACDQIPKILLKTDV